MTVVHSRTARHQRIVDLLGRIRVRSQAELAGLLADDGFAVTQATLSRDLDELGAVKVRDGDGRLCYAVPGEGGDPTPRPVPDEADRDKLRRRCQSLLVSVRQLGQHRHPAHAARRAPSSSPRRSTTACSRP